MELIECRAQRSSVDSTEKYPKRVLVNYFPNKHLASNTFELCLSVYEIKQDFEY